LKANNEKSKIQIRILRKMSRMWNTDCGTVTFLLLTMFRWLLPVFTTRQSTAITTHFPGFRRISIDDMRKTQVRLSQPGLKIDYLETVP
jgi:hypothetical protein